MLKHVFTAYAVCAIMAPWVFLLARMLGIYNFGCDSGVFGVLFVISGVVLFLTYKRW